MIFPNNTLFKCDGLNLLERLPSESVTLVYLNPLVSIGTQRQGRSKESKTILDRDLASYLSKIIQQAKRSLNDRGSLFVHCSPPTQIDVRLITSQVFGGQPVHEIAWPRNRFANMAGRGLKPEHDFLLVYCKTEHGLGGTLFRPISSEEAVSYSKADYRGPYRLVDLTTALDRPSQQQWRGFTLPPGRAWRYSIDSLETLANEDRIHFPQAGGRPWIKQYLADHPGIQIGTTWDDIPDNIMPSQRVRDIWQAPTALMERIVKLASKEDDRVLDPFCGSGTTLIAAQAEGRAWWGADSFQQAQEITIARLLTASKQGPTKHFEIIEQQTLDQYQIVELDYKNVLANIDEIAALQRDAEKLIKSVFDFKKSINLQDDADEATVEKAIAAVEKMISESAANQSASLDSYIDQARKWMNGWEALDKASRLFLPWGELLFETIERKGGGDFSPFILQYCRALENELLQKLFSAYTNDFTSRHSPPRHFLAPELEDKKTGKFAKFLNKGDSKYTLGDMNFIMNLCKANGSTLKKSELLQDFRAFTLRYFENCIVEEEYLEQIRRITEDFRNHAAHPNVLDREVALRCREAVRQCINELIVNYKNVPESSASSPIGPHSGAHGGTGSS